MTAHQDGGARASTQRSGPYALLSAYGLLGDGHAGALVAADGAIDWLAAPRLDSPPICAALLDPADGGSFTLAPAVEYEAEQRYVDDTLVLQTTYRCREGTVRVTDSLNRGWSGPLPWTELARAVDGVAGQVPMRWRFTPGTRLGTGRPYLLDRGGHLLFRAGALQVAVVADPAGYPDAAGACVAGQFRVGSGERALLAVVASEGQPLRVAEAPTIRERIQQTQEGWCRWAAGIAYHGEYSDAVRRSALTLRALTLSPSGAMAAALTTSLPEALDADRNFDYRFGWARDASFALDAMLRLELDEDVHVSLSWLLAAIGHTAPSVRSFYTLDGVPAPADADTVDSAPGYRGTRPVRLGNPAADQLQLGTYGDMLDAAWHYTEHGGYLDADSAGTLGKLADRVCEVWREPDAGIWELGNYEHYTISKMGCWVALDRAVHLAEAGQIGAQNLTRWRQERDAVHAWTDEHCWSSRRRSYTFYAGTDELGAAVLLAARTGYLTGDDPRLASTIDAVRGELGAGGPLLYRYTAMVGSEGAFLACTFWLVEALCTVGRRDEAATVFDASLGYAGASGLLSEQVDPGTGELRGNLPQALTHLALIGAATALAGAAPSAGPGQPQPIDER